MDKPTLGTAGLEVSDDQPVADRPAGNRKD
jgi:hypothetical protein